MDLELPCHARCLRRLSHLSSVFKSRAPYASENVSEPSGAAPHLVSSSSPASLWLGTQATSIALSTSSDSRASSVMFWASRSFCCSAWRFSSCGLEWSLAAFRPHARRVLPGLSICHLQATKLDPRPNSNGIRWQIHPSLCPSVSKMFIQLLALNPSVLR